MPISLLITLSLVPSPHANLLLDEILHSMLKLYNHAFSRTIIVSVMHLDIILCDFYAHNSTQFYNRMWELTISDNKTNFIIATVE